MNHLKIVASLQATQNKTKNCEIASEPDSSAFLKFDNSSQFKLWRDKRKLKHDILMEKTMSQS